MLESRKHCFLIALVNRRTKDESSQVITNRVKTKSNNFNKI